MKLAHWTLVSTESQFLSRIFEGKYGKYKLQKSWISTWNFVWRGQSDLGEYENQIFDSDIYGLAW